MHVHCRNSDRQDMLTVARHSYAIPSYSFFEVLVSKYVHREFISTIKFYFFTHASASSPSDSTQNTIYDAPMPIICRDTMDIINICVDTRNNVVIV